MDRTYAIRDAKIFERYAHTLHEWAETTTKEGDIRLVHMRVDGTEHITGTTKVISLSRIR
jgi:hypothetical protein